MRKTKHKTFSLRSRTTSLLLALLLTVSAASVGFAAIASAVSVDDDSGGFLAMTGAGNDEMTAGISSGDDSSKAFWVDATYYDYLSDTERDPGGSWLNPKKAGTQFNQSEDDWYEFYTFNNDISYVASQTGSNWNYPLYFGNFCNKVNEFHEPGNDYVTTSYDKSHDGPYEHAISGLKNYEYYINNSNGLTGENGISGYHYSITGLAADKLDSGMNLQYADGKQMPYFNSSWVRSDNRGRVINSSFPFRTKTEGTLTTYSFDSTGAKDNVFFNWNGTTPQTVGYGQGIDDNGNTANVSKYGVKDGIQYFMDPEMIDADTGKKYKDTNYYGIFPFNRATGSNGGNNNLNYGFGIKMNMDFRVPKDGKNGTTPIQFTYSGDDDLWVYITPYKTDGSLDTANSQLVLDLGGNHKKATGNINFATMKATQDHSYHASHNVDFRPDTIYIENSDNNKFSNIYVNAWNNGSSNNTWITPGKATIGDKEYYTVTAAQMGGRDRFLIKEHNNWDDGDKKEQSYLEASGYYGNLTYTNNINWITEKLPDDKRDGSVIKNFGFEATGSSDSNGATYKTLDPDKTYRMTIFYMERGMLESNCQMSFTMTPVKNDFKVKKTIDTEHLNPGLVSDVTQAESFDFTTQEGTSVRKDTKYILNSNWKDVNSQSGVYALKSGEVADFPNQHETVSDLKVTETAPTGTIQYTTEWEVVDNSNSGAVIKLKDGTTNASGTGLETGTFVLTNPQNASAPANLQANFVNTPKVAPITVSKTVVDKDNNAITPDDPFTFKIQLNVGYGLKAYNLVDSNGNTATGGEFTLTAGQSITFNDIPVGATYTITETLPDGYKCKSYSVNGTQTTSTDGKMSVTTTVRENSNTVAVTNTPGEVTASFDVEKAIQSGTTTTPYKNGSLFSFTAEGLSAVEYADGKTSKDIHTMSKTVTSIDANGKANFANSGQSTDTFLKFDKPGVYILKVSENDVSFTDTTGKTYKSDITKSTQQFLVKITVTASTTNPGEMTTANEYYKYTGGNVTKANFAESNKVTVMQFVNPVKTGKITVNKKDGANAALQGVQFTLYKKNGDTLTAVGQPKTTNSSGVAVFDNLDIYVTGTEYTGEPAYQTYVLKETQTKSGHMQEATVYTFSFPTYDSQAQAYKYEYTFDYVNAALKHPQTGMFDNLNNTPLGIALIFLSFVSIGLYLAKLKRKQLLPINNKRFY